MIPKSINHLLAPNNPSETDLIVVFPENSPWDVNIPNVKIILGNQLATNTISLGWEELGKGIKAIQQSQKCESLLIEAIRNFIRKINFDELRQSLLDDEISKEAYSKELKINGDKYAITLRNIATQEDVINIINLMTKIGYDLREFSASEIAEMFSVKEHQLISIISSLPPIIK